MLGVPEPEYVAARGVLLDALDALRDQAEAVVIVGAQAIYLHTGAADFAVAEYTTDADLALNPAVLNDRPELEQAMRSGGFLPDLQQPGTWLGKAGAPVDLLVPDEMGGAGRRGARLGVHGDRVAERRKASKRRSSRTRW